MPISYFWGKRYCNFAKIHYELIPVLLQSSSTASFWIYAKYNHEWEDTWYDQRSLALFETIHCCSQKDLAVFVGTWTKVSLVPTRHNKILRLIPLFALKRDKIHSLQVHNKGNNRRNRKRTSSLAHQIKRIKVYHYWQQKTFRSKKRWVKMVM